MGKLVVFLADGTTQDVKLHRERVTIGRRPDNDVCLPRPAVSGVRMKPGWMIVTSIPFSATSRRTDSK